MKVDRLETHDRYVQLMKEQSDILSAGALECLKYNPLSLAYQKHSPYIYIFGHPRTHDNGYHKRYLWQARLSKPKAQTNSYLFRVKSFTEEFEICWLLPPREMWDQYRNGNITESKSVNRYIHLFEHNRQELEKPNPEDCSEERFWWIMNEIQREAERQKRIKQVIEGEIDGTFEDIPLIGTNVE